MRLMGYERTLASHASVAINMKDQGSDISRASGASLPGNSLVTALSNERGRTRQRLMETAQGPGGVRGTTCRVCQCNCLRKLVFFLELSTRLSRGPAAIQ